MREPGRNGRRNVVIARDRQNGPVEAAQESCRIGELAVAAPMAEIPARDHELGLKPGDQQGRTPLDRGIVTRSEMEVGKVQNTCEHSRWRL